VPQQARSFDQWRSCCLAATARPPRPKGFSSWRTTAEDDQNQRLSDLEQQAPPAPEQQAPAAAETSPMLDQLNQLATLHQQGVLTDDEFTAAMAKLLGG
jgi:hypothetical protein